MPLHPTWSDVALRLILTMIAGGIIGFNRGVRGHGAGLRTTILVGLAGSRPRSTTDSPQKAALPLLKPTDQ